MGECPSVSTLNCLQKPHKSVLKSAAFCALTHTKNGTTFKTKCAFLLLNIHNGISLFWHLHYHSDNTTDVFQTAFVLRVLSCVTHLNKRTTLSAMAPISSLIINLWDQHMNDDQKGQLARWTSHVFSNAAANSMSTCCGDTVLYHLPLWPVSMMSVITNYIFSCKNQVQTSRMLSKSISNKGTEVMDVTKWTNCVFVF